MFFSGQYAGFQIMSSGVLSILWSILENSVKSQMDKSISVPFDQNIRDLLWRWST